MAVVDTDLNTVRPARAGDVPAVTAFLRRHNTGLIGLPDCTEDEVRGRLTEPGMVIDRDSRVVVGGRDGAVTGFATVSGAADLIAVDVTADDPDPLVSWVVERAREMGRERGHATVHLDHGVYRADEVLAGSLAAHGFAVATTFHRMRIDHVPPVPEPEPPARVTARRGPGADVRRDAHRVLIESFTEHYGYEATPFGLWHARLDHQPGFEWDQLWVADLDGRPAGTLLCDDSFAESGCGYVADLGVLREARGHGIARFLLRHAFAVDAAAGRVGTVLHVDSNNTTPALSLYTSVGMRAVLVLDAWRRTVATS